MPLDFDGLVLGPCLQAFGEPVDYSSLAAGITFPLTAAFDQLAHTSTFSDYMASSSEKSSLGVQLSQFPPGIVPSGGDDADSADTVVVRGVAYWVTDVKPDGVGHAKLSLMIKPNS